jgi:hypothetical protein
MDNTPLSALPGYKLAAHYFNDDAKSRQDIKVNQTGFTGEHKAWKVRHDQRKFRKPFFDRSSGARSAFGA